MRCALDSCYIEDSMPTSHGTSIFVNASLDSCLAMEGAWSNDHHGTGRNAMETP